MNGVSDMNDKTEGMSAPESDREALEMEVLLDSPAIQRLVDEVRAEEDAVPRSYNRTFNRHNR